MSASSFSPADAYWDDAFKWRAAALEDISQRARHSAYDPRLKFYSKLGEHALLRGMGGAAHTVAGMDAQNLHTEAARIALILDNAADGTVSLNPRDLGLAQSIAERELWFYDGRGHDWNYFTHDCLRQKLVPVPSLPNIPMQQALKKADGVAEGRIVPTVAALELEPAETVKEVAKKEESNFWKALIAIFAIILVIAIAILALL